MKKITLLILLIKISIVNAQIFGTQQMIEDENIKIKPWIENDIKNYVGLYSFGESEAESSIHLTIADKIICVQLEEGDWASENGKLIGWHMKYKNFSNVRIEGNLFFSDQSNGEFVTFIYNNTNRKGLKLENPPIQTGSNGDYEIGSISKPDKIGKYFNTKEDILTDNILSKMNKSELKIMRNEIYARYHYIFKTKQMSEYFKKQDWYSGYHNNIDLYLTKIEKENIKKIKAFEKSL
ncbi:YARHG domain-containing protein [Cellulophaga baltica]|uniref:YARHG domain-containing protein n=1 Tax=Cellulophaga baltica TaxID=76594 RepID=UPI0037CB0766